MANGCGSARASAPRSLPAWSACPATCPACRPSGLPAAPAWRSPDELAHATGHRHPDRGHQGLVIMLVVVVAGALLSFIERRLLGWWQDRHGPNRVGPFGMFQLAADMLKMFFKEDWTPLFADRLIFTLAPVVAMSALLIAFAIVPITPTWGVADLNIGILFFFAMAGLTVYAVLFAGWSSANKFALLGALRASAQTLSYEVFLGLSLM